MALLDPLPSSAWNERTARHLLSRAGFGIPRERVGELTRVGREHAVNAMVAYEALPGVAREPSYLPKADDYYAYRVDMVGGDPDDRRAARQKFIQEENGRVQQLREWWLNRMLASPRPLEEKMTLFWHGHFATSTQKVKYSRPAFELNQLFRANATGNFKTLTTKVGQSRSMIEYLDNHRNIKGKPNENWARELMELFTLGAGNYTEADIKESARAFTGWTFSDQGFAYREEVHDFGEKTFFGERGNFDGWDIIDIIFRQPQASRFMAEKLWRFFAYDEPEPALVEELAAAFREHHYEVKPVLRTMFSSQAFYSERAMGTQIKSPAQFVVQLAHDLRLDPVPYRDMARACAALGQNLYAPPNVKGWDGGRAWINANALVTRYNLPKALLMASVVTEEDGGGEMMMSSGPDSITPLERGISRAKSIFRQLPREERLELRDQLKDAPGFERQAILDRYLLQRPLDGIWDPRNVLDDIPFGTAGECVERIASRYLAGYISAGNRRLLVEALTGSSEIDRELKIEDVDAQRLEQTLRLMLSMAEYQLC